MKIIELCKELQVDGFKFEVNGDWLDFIKDEKVVTSKLLYGKSENYKAMLQEALKEVQE